MGRQQGTLVVWNDDRGFGFIEPDQGGDRLFVHIKSIGEIATRPQPGDRVTYSIGTGRDGRPAADNVVIAGANPRDRAAERRGLPPPPVQYGIKPVIRILGAALIFAFCTAAVTLGRAPSNLLLIYLIIGVISFYRYWRDKRAAEEGTWRSSENSLHLGDLVFGIVGGLLAQAVLRHKVSKPQFAAVSGGIAALHIVGLTLLILGVVNYPGL